MNVLIKYPDPSGSTRNIDGSSCRAAVKTILYRLQGQVSGPAPQILRDLFISPATVMEFQPVTHMSKRVYHGLVRVTLFCVGNAMSLNMAVARNINCDSYMNSSDYHACYQQERGLYFIILYRTILYYTILYYSILYYTLLRHLCRGFGANASGRIPLLLPLPRQRGPR